MMAPAFSRKPASAALTWIAYCDASRNVSIWRWAAFGAVLGHLSAFNILLLVAGLLVVNAFAPKIDLSVPRRLMYYFQDPARYTLAYRQRVKRLRCRRTLYWWFLGLTIF